MGLFNSIKSFVTDNKGKQITNDVSSQMNSNQAGNFNSGSNSGNNGQLNQSFNTVEFPSTQHHLPPQQQPNFPEPIPILNQSSYLRPNENYKNNQLNDTGMLHQATNQIRPPRMNPSNQYNYYINETLSENGGSNLTSNANATLTEQQVERGNVEPYYNHDSYYIPPMSEQYLPRRIHQQYSNSYNQYLDQSYGQNPYGNNGYGYQNVTHPNLYGNAMYNDVQHSEYYNNYHSPNRPIHIPTGAIRNENNEHFAMNPEISGGIVNQQNGDQPSVLVDQANANENKRYAYQPQLGMKKHSTKFSRDQANKLMPLEIAREIRSEKIRTLVMVIVGTCGVIATTIFIALYYIAHNNNLNGILGIRTIHLPHPLLTISLLIISLGILFAGVFDLSRVRIEAQNYLLHLSRGNHTIPHFLIDNYKRMVVRGIILNWVAFPTYFFGTIVIGILYGFQQHAGDNFMFGFWNWGTINDLTAAITIGIVVLITMLGLHITNIVLTKRRKANIIGYYGYEIVRPEELAELRKRTNHICLIVFIIFLIILTLLISIPWLIAKRKKTGNGVSFFSKLFGAR